MRVSACMAERILPRGACPAQGLPVDRGPAPGPDAAGTCLPCGGQGRCGRCLVEVREGEVRRRSVMPPHPGGDRSRLRAGLPDTRRGRLGPLDSPRRRAFERFERGDRAEKAAPEVVLCDHGALTLGGRPITWCIEPPTWRTTLPTLERLQRELARQHGLRDVEPTLAALADLPGALRTAEWDVTAVVEQGNGADPEGRRRLLSVVPGLTEAKVWGVAIDIGTTTVVVYLGDLATGRLLDHASAYNEQIACGEDVISRIIYARRSERRQQLQERVAATINGLIDEMLARQGAVADDLKVATVAGNTTMIHLFLGLDPQHIRLEPYIPTPTRFLPLPAARLGLHMHPEAIVDCLPGVGAYVGADITAGVLRSGMAIKKSPITLFIDVGTNGEMVLGNSEWLISCACSAGPAFEGAGVDSGMRATAEPSRRCGSTRHTPSRPTAPSGTRPPRGICGSGMISLLGEMFVTGVIDKSGRIAAWPYAACARGDGRGRVRGGLGGETRPAARHRAHRGGHREPDARQGLDLCRGLRAGAERGAGHGQNRARAHRRRLWALHRHRKGHRDRPAARSALGALLLPGQHLGAGGLAGAAVPRASRREVDEIASKMTYLELSADNSFMEAFTSALFLPHTDWSSFPSVWRPRRRPAVASPLIPRRPRRQHPDAQTRRSGA